MKFFEEFKVPKNCESIVLIKKFSGLAEMSFRLVNASFSLPKCQAVKMTFFVPCLSRGFNYYFFISVELSDFNKNLTVVDIQYIYCGFKLNSG